MTQWRREMLEGWYYMRRGRQEGPIPFEQLKQLVASGQLRAVDEVWKQGTPDWRPIKSIAELADALPVPSLESSPAKAEGSIPASCPSAAAVPGSNDPVPDPLLWQALVRTEGRYSDCLVLFYNRGIKAIPISDPA